MKARKVGRRLHEALRAADKYTVVFAGGPDASCHTVWSGKDHGLLEPVGRGHYRLTDAGRSALETGRYTPLARS